ncbi:TetR family transcriptional regulator (plasmid) [Halarchaeum sp. CBA1220]|uniref:TetR/AcrR family transcriptional regulator n=1 Tax=Halarchaeum sp. CBA1220 TaxID=1853682 RepID=UPI000F3A85A0|nr:TetR/AcrR family transcriptional regulator [Halarchaeum sp. CBA1220]QLC34714.1 TetR family transcriptional regulator [Halarchaeum sp. CBA1220]
MDDDGPFPEEPADTRTAIMRATYDALCKHGYADLTIQRIGEEFPKSKSLLYHHYEGKDDLLLEFLGYMLERFEEREAPADGAADPETRLRDFLDHTIPVPGEERNPDFLRALVELRAQAAHDEAYREQFTRTQERFHEHLADIVADGVETGAFRDVDPEQVASFLATVLSGAMFDRVTTDSDVAAAARAELHRYVDDCLLAEST